jgi:hypothetical protein
MADALEFDFTAQVSDLLAGLQSAQDAMSKTLDGMSAQIDQVSSKLDAELPQASAKAATALDQVKESSEGLGGALSAMKNALSTALEVTGIAAAAEGVHKLMEEFGEAADRAVQFKQAAQITGTTTEQFQGIAAAAAEMNIPVERVTRTMEQLQAKMIEAAKPGSEAAKVFSDLGITMQQLQDPSFDVIKAMEQLGVHANSNAQLIQLLGARGAVLIPLLREMATNHDLLGESFAKVGGLADNTINTLAGYNAVIATAGEQWENFKSRMLAAVVPAFVEVIQQIYYFNGQMKDLAAVVIAVGASVIDTIVAMANASYDAAHGRFAQAWADMKTGAKEVGQEWVILKDTISANAKEAEDSAAALDQIMAKANTSADPGSNDNQAAASAQRAATAATEAWVKAHEKITADHRKMIDDLLAEDERELAATIKIIDAKTELAVTGAKTQEAVQLGAIRAQQAAVTEAYKTHQITSQQELSMTQDLLAQELEATMAALQAEEEAYAGDPKKMEEIYLQEAQAQMAYLDKMGKANNTYISQQSAQWQAFGNKLSSTMSTQLDKVLAGSESFGRAMRNTFATMVEAIISSLIKVGVQLLINEAISKATGASAAKSNVMANAAQAASGAYAAISAIPYVGPFLAPAAAAAVYAGALAFPIPSAAGGWEVPYDTLANVHKDEKILPAATSAGLDRLIQGGSGGGETHNYHGAMNFNGVSDDWLRKTLTSPSGRSQLFKAAGQAIGRGTRVRQ